MSHWGSMIPTRLELVVDTASPIIRGEGALEAMGDGDVDEGCIGWKS